MTIFLSGPMTGLPGYNYPAFAAAAWDLRARGRHVVSPHELHDGKTNLPYIYYLRHDLKALLECTELVVLPGWRNSFGAQLEVRVAAALDMPITEYKKAQP